MPNKAWKILEEGIEISEGHDHAVDEAYGDEEKTGRYGRYFTNSYPFFISF